MSHSTRVIASTDEARALVSAGEVKPGDAALDRPVESMTDREIAEETLLHLRIQRDVVNGLITQIMASPLGGMIGAKGANGVGSLFGG
jgi:hypothetical protein